MWAGVAGGIAEYFDLDPAIVRLLWVAAAVVTGGAAIAVYILAWIILPRDDRPPAAAQSAWGDWSWRADTAEGPPPGGSTFDAATEKGTPTADQPSDQPWWQSQQYSPHRYHHRPHTRSTGVVLVALGVLLLAANAGVFNWIEWRNMWPLIFIGLGIILLGRQWSR
jgi:phage shock protein PspC (stress-responsive transcriptional regulator)